MVPVRFQHGLELPEHGIWLDPHAPKEFAFVSHAHSDHMARHREVIASRATALFLRERLGARAPGARTLEFGVSTVVRGLNLTLLPAGHILGSSQLFLQCDRLGTLLYTGDFKLRSGLSAEPLQWRQADTLVMETTFGLPKYRMPATETVLEQIVAFCRENLAREIVPVLLCYSLGKAQEVLCALAAAGLRAMLHEAVFKMSTLYRQLQPGFPDFERFHPARFREKVLIFPPSAIRAGQLEAIPNRKTAILTGWAVDSGARYRYRCDAAFPLSDHADYDDLLRYVDMVQPRRVLTLHGFAAPFARDLRRRGLEAWALSEDDQLELNLGPFTPKSR